MSEHTWQDVQNWLDQTQPFSAETVIDLLSMQWGNDVQINTGVTVEGDVVAVYASVEFTIVNPDYKEEGERTHGNYRHERTSREGHYVSPLTAPYMSFIQKAEQRAILNALFLFGAEVKVQVDPDEGLTDRIGRVVALPPSSSLSSSATPQVVGPICDDCGDVVKEWVSKGGSTVSVDYHLKNTNREYGKDLCNKCSNKRFAISKKGR